MILHINIGLIELQQSFKDLGVTGLAPGFFVDRHLCRRKFYALAAVEENRASVEERVEIGMLMKTFVDKPLNWQNSVSHL